MLDTWFSSWLWPFSTLGWPDDTADLGAFYPTTTLVSAYDIIFFWVSRMIMAGLHFQGEVPFRDVFITRLVRDHLGRKMSKSLGNGIDPLEVGRLYGADAMRYTLVEGTSWVADQLLNYQDLDATFAPGRNFANKLWNAGRFALMNLEGGSGSADPAAPVVPVASVDDVADLLEPADRWILSHLSKTAGEVTRALDSYRFQEAAQTVRAFFWGEVADWYLELVKPRLRDEAGEDSREAAEATLVAVLDSVFRLLHPIMPFISEELWQRLPGTKGQPRPPSIVVARWPERRPEWEDDAAEESMTALMELIGTVRALRAEYDVPPAARIEVRLADVPPALRRGLDAEERALRRLAGVERVTHVGPGGGSGGAPAARAAAHAVLRGGAELTLPLEGVIDLEREVSRLSKEKLRLEGLLQGVEVKLKNEQFITRAPKAVVDGEREKAASLRDQVERLGRKLASLRGEA